uniref:Uncharacterized protein n=1 Tax=Meleagris gallopavo TaxID=9103 RepID=A0A803XU72_MELGA
MVLDKDVEVGVEFAGLLIEEFSRRRYDRLSPGVLGGVSELHEHATFLVDSLWDCTRKRLHERDRISTMLLQMP